MRMGEELEQRRDFLHDRTIATLYFGGGTPSLCSPRQLERLMGQIHRLYDCGRVGEVTLEANPDDLNLNYLKALRAIGFNRLSIGVQTFDERALRFMNRRHTALQARQAVDDARKAGFENLTIDLIYGIPRFEIESLERSLEEALRLGVEHISAYHLTFELDTRFGRMAQRGELQAVAESRSEEEYALVEQRLLEAGYEHYEISNFALPGFRARHNAAYWAGNEYLGIGPGAHSYNTTHRRWSTGTVEQYASGAPFGWEEECLSPRDRANEYLMTRLRTAEGISLQEIGERFGEAEQRRVETAARPHLESGVLRLSGDRMALPTEKFLLSDWVIGSLFDTEPDSDQGLGGVF